MKTRVTMHFDFDGTEEEAIQYLQTELPYWGAEAITPYIEGEERWEVNGRPIEIPIDQLSEETDDLDDV